MSGSKRHAAAVLSYSLNFGQTSAYSCVYEFLTLSGPVGCGLAATRGGRPDGMVYGVKYVWLLAAHKHRGYIWMVDTNWFVEAPAGRHGVAASKSRVTLRIFTILASMMIRWLDFQGNVFEKLIPWQVSI